MIHLVQGGWPGVCDGCNGQDACWEMAIELAEEGYRVNLCCWCVVDFVETWKEKSLGQAVDGIAMKRRMPVD